MSEHICLVKFDEYNYQIMNLDELMTTENMVICLQVPDIDLAMDNLNYIFTRRFKKVLLDAESWTYNGNFMEMCQMAYDVWIQGLLAKPLVEPRTRDGRSIHFNQMNLTHPSHKTVPIFSKEQAPALMCQALPNQCQYFVKEVGLRCPNLMSTNYNTAGVNFRQKKFFTCQGCYNKISRDQTQYREQDFISTAWRPDYLVPLVLDMPIHMEDVAK